MEIAHSPPLKAGVNVGMARRVWSHWFVRDALIPFVVTRLALCLVGLMALNIMQPPKGFRAWQIGKDGNAVELSDDAPMTAEQPLINMWSRWDSGWLVSVAMDGYEMKPGAQSNSACFPLYPLAMRGLNWLLRGKTQGDMLFAGLLVSNAALLAALAYLILLARLDFDEATAARAAWYFLVFPATLFLSAVYAEGLFVAFTLGSVYRARRGDWWRAGLLGGCAAATRFNGFFILLPMAIEYFIGCGWRWRKVQLNFLALALVPTGTAAYAAYLWLRFGDPFAYLTAAGTHGRHLSPPWIAFQPFFTGTYSPLGMEGSLLDLASAVVLIGLVAWSWRVVRPSYAAFATFSLLVIFSTASLAATLRYGLPLFPMFLVLAVAGRHPLFHQTYLAVAAVLAGFFMALFATLHWVA